MLPHVRIHVKCCMCDNMQWSIFGWLKFIEDSNGVHSIGYDNGLMKMSGSVSKNLTV